MKDLPDELRDLDRGLRSIRFAPRSSFGPELAGRLRRGDQPNGSPPQRIRRHLATAAVTLLFVGGGLVLLQLRANGSAAVTVDRCCYDLDGGGDSDDGVVVVAEPNARVHRLLVYEDRDHSGSLTADDLVRLDRGRSPTIHGMAGEGLVTIERCCLDFDGGGPDDDGLLVIGVPPDRVVMAAIYETGSGSRSDPSQGPGWPLR